MTLTTKLARAALLAALALPATALLPQTLPFAAIEARAGILAEHKQVLTQYGTFQQHAKYGEVWIPSVTPQGWHPYQPCHWIYTKYGWYFDDKTPWGNIVHHYGRWAHEAGTGWMWVAGEEFSPGWVVWKASQDWVGWAPMPPEQDMATLDANTFNTDKMWTFMETEKFGKTCGGAVAPVSQVPVLLQQTAYIKDITFVDGIAVFVFPHWLVGPVINVNIVNINIWSPVFIVHIVNHWHIVWNVTVNINIACALPPPAPAHSPIQNNPPPPPPGKRAELPPPQKPTPPRPGFTPDPQRPGVTPDPQRPSVMVDPIPPRPPTRVIDPVRPRPPTRVVDPVRPRPIDPGFNRPGGKVGGTGPTRPIDPGIGNGRPGGTVGTGPTRPVYPGVTRPGGKLGSVNVNPRPGITRVPQRPKLGTTIVKPNRAVDIGKGRPNPRQSRRSGPGVI